MPHFFRNKRLIVLLVSIIILVALIGLSLSERDKLTMPEQLLKDSAGFVQNIFAKPAHYLAGLYDSVIDLQNTYEENKQLKKHLDEITKLEIEVQQLKSENKKLTDLVDKEDDYRKYDPLQATVIARIPDQWQELVTIDKGSLNGVEKNMAVITAQGLVGKVKQSQQFTSTVQLLSTTDPSSRISASVLGGKKDVYGTIEGYDKKKKMLILKSISNDEEIEEGQDVVTSGLGGIFPQGLAIGKIDSVFPDQHGLTQSAYVEPLADFYSINHLIVVKRSANKDMLDELSQGGE